jgi:hypothetical protein
MFTSNISLERYLLQKHAILSPSWHKTFGFKTQRHVGSQKYSNTTIALLDFIMSLRKFSRLTKNYILIILSFFFLPTLSGIGTCFLSCCDKDSSIIFTTCLTSTLLETGVGANDCKSSREQQLNVSSEARMSSR